MADKSTKTKQARSLAAFLDLFYQLGEGPHDTDRDGAMSLWGPDSPGSRREPVEDPIAVRTSASRAGGDQNG